MRPCFILFLVLAAIAAQHILPGSYSGLVANGRGGLGRFIRHQEHHDDTSYYGNGNGFGGFGYSPMNYGTFGYFG